MLGEELGKVGINFFLLYLLHVLAIVQKSWTSLCELIHFISRLHVLRFTSPSASLSWHIRLSWQNESNALAEWVDCIRWMRRLRWLNETAAVTEGVESDDRRRRMRWLEEEEEHEPLNRFFYTIPHRDNNIKIVVFHIFALRFPL